jgi:hypothetical protein
MNLGDIVKARAKVCTAMRIWNEVFHRFHTTLELTKVCTSMEFRRDLTAREV